MFNIIIKFLYEFWLDGGEFTRRYVANLYHFRNVAINNFVYYLEQIYIVFIFCRVITPYIFPEYIQFDQLTHFISINKNGLDHCFIVAVLMWIINCFYLRYCICSKRTSNFFWPYFYDIVCRSTQIYERHRRGAEARRKIIAAKSKQIYRKNFIFFKIFPQKLSQFICGQVAKWSLITTLDDVNRETMMRDRLWTFPRITFENRVKNISTILIFDRVLIILLVTLYIVMAVVWSFCCYRWAPKYRLRLPIVMLDLLMFAHSIDLLVRIVIFGANLALIGTNIIVRQLECHNRQVERLIARRKASMQRHNKKSINAIEIDQSGRIVLYRFLREHVRMCTYTLLANRDLFCYTTLETLLVNIPINVALYARILFQALSPFELSITIMSIVVQYVTTAICFLQASKVAPQIHYSKRFLPTLIVGIDSRRQWWLKMKLDSLYHRITSKKPCGVTLGATDKTFESKLLFEILFVYFAYLLFGFNFLIEFKFYK